MVHEGDGEVEPRSRRAAVVPEAQDDDAFPLGCDAHSENGEHGYGGSQADNPNVDAARDGEAAGSHNEERDDEQGG